jgi:hypothetical protein
MIQKVISTVQMCVEQACAHVEFEFLISNCIPTCNDGVRAAPSAALHIPPSVATVCIPFTYTVFIHVCTNLFKVKEGVSQ